MNIKDIYQKIFKKSVSPTSVVVGSDPFAVFGNQSKITAQKALSVYSGWVYACVRAIAENCAKVHLQLNAINNKGEVEEINDSELIDLLNAPNSSQTSYELIYNTVSHLQLTGNSYWLLGKGSGEVSSDQDKPTEIYLLNPAGITKKVEGMPQTIKEYKYTVNTQAKIYEPYQIIHFKIPNPTDQFEGVGVVQSIAEWIDADNYATEFNRMFFLNGARLGGFLESEQARTPEQLDFLRKSFDSVYKGVSNAHKVAVLPKGTTFKSGQLNSKDMDFVNLQNMSRDNILAGFRVPRTILGTSESLTNRATAETAEYVFASRTIKPMLELISTFINERLTSRFGDNLSIQFENPVPKDKEAEIAVMTAGTSNQPVISINEARKKYYGLPPIDNGDAVRGAMTFQPIGVPQKQKKAIKLPMTSNGRASKKIKKISKSIASDVSSVFAKEVASKLVKDIKPEKKSIIDMTDNEYEAIWKTFVVRVTPYEDKMKDELQKMNVKQKAEVIENIRNIKSITNADILDEKKAIGITINVATPILTDLYKKEGIEASKLIGAEVNPLNLETQKAIDHAVKLMATSYTQETLKLLKDKITEDIKNGGSTADLEKSISDIYEFNDTVRAERVARTETYRIANMATKEAWKQTGVVKTIKWYTALDERVCEFCGSMQGRIISIDKDYFKKGDTITGSDGGVLNVEYDDIGSPPLHINCRCYTRPDFISVDI